MPLPLVPGVKLPRGYFIEELSLVTGRRYRAGAGTWRGFVRRGTNDAVNDAFDHFYSRSGAKPLLRCWKGYYTEALSGLHVTDKEVRQVRTFAEAFRLKAERFRAYADDSRHEGLRQCLLRSADAHEEVAQRLEVERSD